MGIIFDFIKKKKAPTALATTFIVSAMILSAFSTGETKIYASAFDAQNSQLSGNLFEITTLEDDIAEQPVEEEKEKKEISPASLKESEEESLMITEKLSLKLQEFEAVEAAAQTVTPVEAAAQAEEENVEEKEAAAQPIKNPEAKAPVQEPAPVQEQVVQDIPVETAAIQDSAVIASTEIVTPTEAEAQAATQAGAAQAETTVPADTASALQEQSVKVEQAASTEHQEVTQMAEAETTGWAGSVLNKRAGVNAGPSGKETYYNLPMGGVVSIMRNAGFSEEEYPYWVREDGAKMLGQYVMVAADLKKYPRGSIVESSLGPSIVADTGDFVHNGSGVALDIATNWR